MLKNTSSGLQRCRWQYGSFFIRLALLLPLKSAKSCEIIRKFGLISSRPSKVIDLGGNRKRICNYSHLSYSNFGRILYRLRDIDAFISKIACFPPTPPLFDASWRRKALRYQRNLYTALGYNSVAESGSFVQPSLTPKSEKSREIPRKLELIG